MSLFGILVFRQIYAYFRQLLNIENKDLTDKYLASINTLLFVSSVLNLALYLSWTNPGPRRVVGVEENLAVRHTHLLHRECLNPYNFIINIPFLCCLVLS